MDRSVHYLVHSMLSTQTCVHPVYYPRYAFQTQICPSLVTLVMLELLEITSCARYSTDADVGLKRNLAIGLLNVRQATTGQREDSGTYLSH